MYTLASRGERERSKVEVGGVTFGDGGFVMIAGPCAIESQAQLGSTARHVATRIAANIAPKMLTTRSNDI